LSDSEERGSVTVAITIEAEVSEIWIFIFSYEKQKSYVPRNAETRKTRKNLKTVKNSVLNKNKKDL
jgi:hypothetical protein